MISPIEIVFYLGGAIAFFSLIFAVFRFMAPLLSLIEDLRLLVPVVKDAAEQLSSVLGTFNSRNAETTGSGETLRALGNVVADAFLRKR